MMAELERLAIQAEYTNDIERLQAIQQIMQQIAENGYASAQDIAQMQQWGIENSQNSYFQLKQLEQAQQQIEMQKQQLQEEIANGKIDRQTAEKQLALLDQEYKYNAFQMQQLGIS